MRSLSFGCSGRDVVELQQHLTLIGISITDSGIFEASTLSAVKQFQANNGLPVTGVVDRFVWEAIARSSSLSEPCQQLVPDPIESPNCGKLYGGIPPVLVILVVDNESKYLPRLLVSIERQFSRKKWALVAIDNGSADSSYTILKNFCRPSLAFKLERIHQKIHPNMAVNYAIDLAGELVFEYPMVVLANASSAFNSGIEAIVAEADRHGLVAMGDYAVNDSLIRLDKGASLHGSVPPMAVVFNSALIDAPGLFRGLDDSWDKILLRWLAQGIFPSYVSSLTHTSRAFYSPSLDTASRLEAFEEIDKPQKISALMLTGRCLERYELARVAVDCFMRQTWPNKELVIINHGELSLDNGDPRIREVRVTRGKMTIGDLRNLSIENATGEWMIQWDDDDWHHPTRMANQMAVAGRRVLSTYLWQVRANLDTGEAFFDLMPGGQHMSILFHRSVRHRYLQLNAAEDTKFKENFSEVVAIDNHPLNLRCDPFQYVRFYHGNNIWDIDHIMGGSQRSDAKTKLADFQVEKLAKITSLYRSAPIVSDNQ